MSDPAQGQFWEALATRLPAELAAELRHLVAAGLTLVSEGGRPALVLTTNHARVLVRPARGGAPLADAFWDVIEQPPPHTSDPPAASATLTAPPAELHPTGTEGAAPVVAARSALEVNYELIRDAAALAAAVPQLARHSAIACDTETTGLDPLTDRVRLLQLGTPQCVYIIDTWAVPDLQPLAPLFGDPTRVFVFQNAKFDVKFLRRLGFDITSVFDTMLAAQLLDAGLGRHRFGLGELTRFYLDIELDKSLQTSDWSGALSPAQLRYAARDVHVLHLLRDTMIPVLKRDGLVATAKLEFDCVAATAEMELAGMGLDRAAWEELGRNLTARRAETASALTSALAPALQKDLFGRPSVNLDSNPQLLDALGRLGVPVTSTDRLAVAPLAREYPVLQALLDYRHYAKAVSAFSDSLPRHIHPKSGRLHPDYRQIGAATGRFSCNGPNLQQIPHTAEYRRCFVPAPGHRLIIADYSQIELRIVAQMAGDARMIAAYQNGEDLHRLTASIVSDIPVAEVSKAARQAAKAINFGLVYAMGARGLAAYAQNTYGVDMSETEAERFRTRFFAAYAGVARWHDRQRREGAKETRTLGGRLRRFDNPALTQAYNAPVQGTSADITKRALGALYRRLSPLGVRLIGTVHDEILVEAPTDQAEAVCEQVVSEMVAAGQAYLPDVPVEVEAHVAGSWAEK